MRWIRRGLIALAAVVALAAATVAAGLILAERRAARRVEVAVQPVALPTDAAELQRGRYLFASRGCADCHGDNAGGRTFVRSGDSLHLAGPDITGSADSVTLTYQPVDWVRAVRHGVKPDGRPLRVMPSEDYNRLTDADLGAIVAYVQSLPPARGSKAIIELPLPARALYGFGAIPDAAQKIDHTLPPATPVAEGVTVEHGRYVANMCLGCHGAALEGGRIPGGPPDWPAAARLVPGDGNAMTRYANADVFLAMLATGKSPEGRALAVMPFAALSQLSPTDARALHLYLTSLNGKAP
jgi:mono/diheme cytochrome c family protein